MLFKNHFANTLVQLHYYGRLISFSILLTSGYWDDSWCKIELFVPNVDSVMRKKPLHIV